MKSIIRKTLAGLFFAMIFSQSQGQLMHGYGGVISYQFMQTGDYILFTNATYSPRLLFGVKENSSFSLGLPVSVGVGLVNDGYGGLYLGGEVPLFLDANFGRKSNPEIEDGFGWYAGAGFGYRITYLSGDETFYNSYGPMIRLGMRVGSGRKNPDKTLNIGLSFKQGLEADKWKTFGLTVIQDL